MNALLNATVLNATANESNSSNDLTSPAYWDAEWCAAGLSGEAVPASGAGKRGTLDKLLVSLLDATGSDAADIMELGCAPGKMLQRMHTLRPRHRYHGVDYAPKGLEMTRGFLGSASVDAVIHQADIRSFQPLQEYDLVLSLGLVEHFPDPTEIFAAHRRICRSGGLVAVTVPNYAHPLAKWFIRQLDPEALKVHCLSIMNPESLRNHMVNAGLQEVRSGASGPPTLRTATSQLGLVRRALRHAGRGWNAIAPRIPKGLLWNSVIWATGRCP